MKRIITLMLVIVMTALLLPCFGASAAGTKEYYVPELTMTIDIPEQTAVITSSVRKNDPLFSDGTFEYISTMTKMRDDSAVLYGKNIAADYEIEIISTSGSTEVDAKNLSKLSDKQLDKQLAKYTSQSDIVESDIYKNGYLTFFRSSRTLNDGTDRYFYNDYFTVYKKQEITVRLISKTDNIKEDEKVILQAMADSMKFPTKQNFNFAQMSQKGIFVSFFVIAVGFILVILYRKHDEAVNQFVLAKIIIIKNKLDERADAKNGKSKEQTAKPEQDSPTPAADEKTDTDKKPAAEEDEDLSSIDLDEAIAMFDDSISGDN